MKTMRLENLDQRVTEALKQQNERELILLTEGSNPLGVLVRVPDTMQDSNIDGVFWREDENGHRVAVTLQITSHLDTKPRINGAQPVFGSCREMLTIVQDDDEHLRDFQQYMK